MRRSILLWLIALLITIGSALYQRLTGPTYPVSGKVRFDGKEIKYELARSHAGVGNHVVKIETNDDSVSGFIEWKRYKTSDDWTRVSMVYQNGILTAELPHQPPAGKLLYHIKLSSGQNTISVPEVGSVVIRFRGDVPPIILFVHIVLMFLGLLTSTRVGIESLLKEFKQEKLVFCTIGLFIIGGLIFGPIVQKYAFGSYWTGWPLGSDLTDNKTAVMVLLWIGAAIALKKSKKPNRWILSAAILTLIVYLIPHSLLGSELDYSKIQ